jgi:ABC-type Co2+ transport system permease subunit
MELAIIIGIVLAAGAVSTALFVRKLKRGGGGCACQGQSCCTQRSSCSDAKDTDQSA